MSQTIRRSGTLTFAIGHSFPWAFLLLLAVLGASQATAQSLNASRLGLEQVWSKAILTGVKGKVSGIAVHVSPNKTYSATSVTDRYGRSSYFSGRQLGTSRGGYDQSARLAQLRAAELTARGLDPQQDVQQIPEVTLYVRSSFGTVTAIDAETGNEKWTAQAGKRGYPSYSVGASDDYVAAVSSSMVYLIDSKTGQVLESLDSDFLPAATPQIDGDKVYVPTRNGVIRVLSAENLNLIEYTYGSTRISSPLTIGAESVSWATERGQIYVANASGPGTKFRFKSLDKIVAAPAYMDGRLFPASLDGFLYGVSEKDGTNEWSYSVGGEIRNSPLAAGGKVYATTVNGQAVAVDAATGEPAWSASGVMRFVAVSNSRVYCETFTGELAALDVESGGRVGSARMSRNSKALVNTNTDRIYVVSNSGVLTCLRERGSRWPTARIPKRGKVAEVVAMEEKPDETAPLVDVPSAEAEEPDDGGFDGFDDTGIDDGTVEEDGLADEPDPFGEDPFGDEDLGDDSSFDDAGF